MNPIGLLRKMFGNSNRSTQHLAEIREGIANMAEDLNDRLSDIAAEQADATRRTERLLLDINRHLSLLVAAVNPPPEEERDDNESGLADKT